MGTGVPGTNPPCDDLFNTDTRCAFVIPAQLRAGFTSPDKEAGDLLDFTLSSAGIFSVTVNVGTGSIVYDISLVEPSSLFVLVASPPDLTWDTSTATTAETVTLTVTNPPSGQVTMQILIPGGAFIDGTAPIANLLYDVCEPSDRTTGNLIYSSIFGACIAETPAGIDGQEFRFFYTNPGTQETVLRIGTESVTFTITRPPGP